MAEPRFRPRSRTERAERPMPARGRRRRPPRRSKAPLALLALLALLVAGGLSLGFAASGALGGEIDDERCGACHTGQPETPLFSHKRHAAGRSCSKCHTAPKHAGFALVKARVGLADPNAARVTRSALRPALGAGRSSALKGHRAVVCSTCHDMRRQSCDACHYAPKPAHYRAACTACHRPDRPFAKISLSHPTFGAHTVAPASCDACHAQDPALKPSCRRCHSNKCGRGVTTMAGCLACHKRGVTKQWLKPTSN